MRKTPSQLTSSKLLAVFLGVASDSEFESVWNRSGDCNFLIFLKDMISFFKSNSNNFTIFFCLWLLGNCRGTAGSDWQ